jgi:hypothetical protein
MGWEGATRTATVDSAPLVLHNIPSTSLTWSRVQILSGGRHRYQWNLESKWTKMLTRRSQKQKLSTNKKNLTWRMPPSGMWRRVGLRIDVSEKCVAPIFRVEKNPRPRMSVSSWLSILYSHGPENYKYDSPNVALYSDKSHTVRRYWNVVSSGLKSFGVANSGT